MIIQHNMLAMNNLMVGKQLQKAKIKNMEQLASGYRINRAADDAANMAISEKMTSRIRALARCQQNIEEGITLAQTADPSIELGANFNVGVNGEMLFVFWNHCNILAEAVNHHICQVVGESYLYLLDFA